MKRDTEDAAIRMIFIRIILGLTQAQLAEEMNCSESYVKKIETGVRPLTTAYLEAFCESLGVSADYVLFGETAMFRNL